MLSIYTVHLYHRVSEYLIRKNFTEFTFVLNTIKPNIICITITKYELHYRIGIFNGQQSAQRQLVNIIIILYYIFIFNYI